MTQAIEDLRFNVAISRFMVFFNHFSGVKRIQSEELITKVITMLSVFAPHICEEILERFDKNRVEFQQWPSYQEEIISKEEERSDSKIAVQVEGRLRDILVLPGRLLKDRKRIEDEALTLEKVRKHMQDCQE